jgi:hypothetical protein
MKPASARHTRVLVLSGGLKSLSSSRAARGGDGANSRGRPAMSKRHHDRDASLTSSAQPRRRQLIVPCTRPSRRCVDVTIQMIPRRRLGLMRSPASAPRSGPLTRPASGTMSPCVTEARTTRPSSAFGSRRGQRLLSLLDGCRRSQLKGAVYG